MKPTRQSRYGPRSLQLDDKERTFPVGSKHEKCPLTRASARRNKELRGNAYVQDSGWSPRSPATASPFSFFLFLAHGIRVSGRT